MNVEDNTVLELNMLKLTLVLLVSFVSFNTLADKRGSSSADSSYERCLEKQKRGFKIGCTKPAETATTPYERCLERQEQGYKIKCNKHNEEREARDEEECVISRNEESTTKTCHGETWVKVTARPDGTVGEADEVNGLDVVDIPSDVQEYLEAELDTDEYIADTESAGAVSEQR